MNIILILIISSLVSAGVYLILSKDLLRIILGLAILATAANLVMFYAGYPGSSTAAIIEPGLTALSSDAPNPLPQALVLTAIVIGFALLCFALLLMVAIVRQSRNRDSQALMLSEPKATANDDKHKPAVLEAE